MNFQVTVLKILVSYPGGFAAMEDLKRDMAILATSGREWADRTKRLAARVPGLDLFSQRLVEREAGGWRVTAKGRAVLEFMEARQPPSEPVPVPPVQDAAEVATTSPAVPPCSYQRSERNDVANAANVAVRRASALGQMRRSVRKLPIVRPVCGEQSSIGPSLPGRRACSTGR